MRRELSNPQIGAVPIVAGEDDSLSVPAGGFVSTPGQGPTPGTGLRRNARGFDVPP